MTGESPEGNQVDLPGIHADCVHVLCTIRCRRLASPVIYPPVLKGWYTVHGGSSSRLEIDGSKLPAMQVLSKL